MKRVKQIVMMAFASLLAQCVWAAIQVGDTVTWSNTGTSFETASSPSDPITECNFNICIPAKEGLPNGSLVRIVKVRLASVNQTFVNWTWGYSDFSFINIEGTRSQGVNGIAVLNTTPGALLDDSVDGALIDSNATTSDKALNCDFGNNGPTLVVGKIYEGNNNNANNKGLALCYYNGNLVYSGAKGDWSTVRYIVSNDEANSVFINPAVSGAGKFPVFELTAKVVSFPDYSGYPDVSFDTPNGPTKAKELTVSNVASLGGNSDYLQYVDGLSFTAAKVTGSTGTPNLFGGFNTGNVGGSVVDDTWMNIVGGTYGIICGGSYCNWGGADKTHNSGDVIIEMSSGSANFILGGNHQEGGSSGAPTWNGDTTIVVKGDAVVKGAIIGAGTVAHSRSQTYTGNTKVVVKNVQSDNTAGQMDGATTDYSDYIVGGGAYASNTNSKLGITGNTAVEIDIAEGKSGDFVKNIVGGGLITEGGSYHNDGVHSKVTGNSSVTISAPSTVKFKGAIVAGGYKVNNCAGDATVSGTATLTLNGGDFSEATIKAGTATGNKILNVNMDMTLAAAIVAEFTHVNIGSGKTLTVNVAEETTLTTIFGGEGALVKAGEGVLTLNANNTLTGGIEVSAGTLKTSSSKGFGPYDETSDLDNMSIIKVAEDAVLDVANVAGSGYGWCYKVELAGELTNSGSAMGTTSRQLAEIKVTGDNAKITGANEYCLLNSGYDPTKLDLNGHTLEVAMTAGKTFHLRTTSITGTGTIKVTSGTLHNTTGTNLAEGADVTVIVTAGAQFDDGVDCIAAAKVKPVNANYVITRSDKIYSAVARSAGTVYLVNDDCTQFVNANHESVTLLGDDVVCVKSGYFTGNRWPIDTTSISSHKIVIDWEVNITTSAENQKFEINVGTSSSKPGVYARNDIAAGTVFTGTGTLFFGYGNNAVINGGTKIGCAYLSTENSDHTIVINGAVTITANMTGFTNTIKLADNATLTVATALADDKVVSGVDTKVVAKKAGENNTIVYGLVAKPEDAPVVPEEGTTFPEGTVIEGATGTVSGTTLPNETGTYTVKTYSNGFLVNEATYGVIDAKAAETTTDRVTTAVAVPFKGKTVATLLNTALLTEGDVLMAWINGGYEVWTLQENKTWKQQPITRAGGNDSEGIDPTTATLKCGQAVWVTTAGKIVTFGDTAAQGSEVELTTGHNLLGNIAYAEATPAAEAGQQVQLIGDETKTRYNKTADGWSSIKQVTTTVGGETIITNERGTAAPVVPVGKGYWLIKK